MSKLAEAPLAFTFDDFTLEPVHSEVMSRKSPDISTDVITDHKMTIPIISAPMNTVTGADMVIAMVEMGGSAVLHRYGSIPLMALSLESILKNEIPARSFFVAVGATGDFAERAQIAYNYYGVRNFCIDVANGDSKICVQAIERIRKLFGEDVEIMAGNVCTYSGADTLAEAGASIIRVGIGPGSMCTTRVVTGHGVPQLSAIEACAEAAFYHGAIVIADGGIRSSGDIVKALAIGADAVMLGNLLAGTEETPGNVIDYDLTPCNGKTGLWKRYAGMASEEGRSEWFDRTKTSFVPEGVSTEIPFKGSVKPIVEGLANGLKVGMSYSNANNLFELRENARWTRVTENGRIEGTPHGKR